MASNTFTLRYLNPNHVVELVSIEQTGPHPSWKVIHFVEEFDYSYSETIGIFVSSWDHQNSTTLPNDNPIGFVVFHRILDEGHILNLVIRPQYRQQGAARTLLREVVQKLRYSGQKRVFLEVRESNAAAISLYNSFGFCKINRRERYYGDNGEAALILSLDLSQVAIDPHSQGIRFATTETYEFGSV